MRRQGKAAPVRSIEGGSAIEGNGGSATRAPFASLLACAALTLCALALFASPAAAELIHPYTGTSFGPEGTTGSATFKSVQGMATDQASHDVYVYDGGAGKIYKFDEDGEPADFSSLGTNVIEGVGQGESVTAAEMEIAIAPAGSPGGTAGDIYIADNTGSFKVFSPAGQPLGEVETGGETCGIATDPAGHVYAGVYPSTIIEYTPSANPPVPTDETAANHEVKYEQEVEFEEDEEIKTKIEVRGAELCNVAVDGAGAVYAASYGSPTYKLESLADTTAARFPFHGTSGLTIGIDPSSSDVYSNFSAEGRTEINQYDASGAFKASLEVSALSSTSRGIAVKAGGDKIYAPADGVVKVFGPAISPPKVSGFSVSVPSDEAATFKAQVNPNTLDTTYAFQYVTEEEFQANGFANAESIPVGGEDLGAGESPVKVEQTLTGLPAGAAYRVRVIATNADRTVTSADRVFVTYFAPTDGLPDGRAYEQATPLDKNGGDAMGRAYLLYASAGGDAVSYFIVGGGGGNDGGGQEFPSYAALRSGEGWSSHAFLPSSTFGELSRPIGWSEDLRRDYVTAGNEGTRALYEQDVASGAMREIAGKANAEPAYADESANGERMLFESEEALAPGAVEGKSNLYLWDAEAGSLSLVDKLPGGLVPSGGAFAGPYFWAGELSQPTSGGAQSGFFTRDMHVMSDDGSKVFFTTSGDNQLYVRKGLDGPSPETVQVSASRKNNGSGLGGTDPNGPGHAAFMEASPDGRYVFFASSEELTNDANTGTADQGKDLYRYDTESGQLIDLTPDSTDENGAQVNGVLGSSADGSYVYFAAEGVLAEGASASFGVANVYLWHEGQLTFITRLGASLIGAAKGGNWLPANTITPLRFMKTARVSEDGKTLSFLSDRSPTAYDSEGKREFYRYNTEEGLECVSCPPTRTPPRGEAGLQEIANRTASPVEPSPALVRNLSADGKRVFFETTDKLVAGDTNGDHGCARVDEGSGSFRLPCMDVYEWEAKGSGSCQSEAQNGGCLYLISTGESNEPSYFVDASANGNDVFFLTRQQLVGQDTDQLRDIYDARVGGGIAAQNEPPPTPCEGEACKPGSSSPPAGSSAGSATFSGPGNPKPNRHKKKHARKHHKKHAKKKHHSKARASANERGQR